MISRVRIWLAAMVLLVFAAVLLALSGRMYPVSPNIQSGWSVVAGCTDNSDEWNCVDEAIGSTDGDTSALTGDDSAGVTDEFTMGNKPSDFGTMNSFTLYVSVEWIGSNDDNDRVDVSLWVSGVQSGGTKCFSHNDTACACTKATTGYTTCTFTDAAWNGLTSGDLNSLTARIVTVANNVSMPDTTTFHVSTVDTALDYNAAAARSRVVMIARK